MADNISRAATPAEIAQIAEFNRTEAEFPAALTLNHLIEAQFERHPSRIAVICDHDRTFGTQSLTNAEVNAKANQLAHRLRAEGIGPRKIVALMVERSFAMAIGILGIVKAGAAYLPLPPDNPPDRTDYILKDGGVAVLLVHGKTAGRTAFEGAIIDLDDPSVYQGSEANPVHVNKPEDLAYVIYTSGSTGRPKGVMIEHRAVVNRLHWMQRAYPIGERDVILQKTPYYFDVSVWELFWWALQGAKLCFLAPGGERNPLVIVDQIRAHEISVVHFVPSMLSVFVDYLDGRSDAAIASLASVRRIFASGEALASSHVKKFNDVWGAKTGARLTNLYGPTEATVDVSYFDCPTHNDFQTVPIGRPIDNIKLYVIQNGRQVGIGENGELCIAGVGLARGYLNNAVLTGEKFTDNPVNPGERIYRTGDVARWLSDGTVEYLGREDHQVKIRGLRIELGEIENTVRSYPGILDCVAVVKKYSESVILIVVYIVCKDGPDLAQLKLFLKKTLPDYMVPNHFERIPEMPLTPSGKADRRALPEPTIPARPLADRQDAVVALAEEDLEISLTKVCERVLGIERVGIHDNFFELGAHSLAVIKLIVEIKQATGLDIDIGEVFRTPTIADMMLTLHAKKNASIVVPLQPKGEAIPIFCICGIDIYREFAQSVGENQPVCGVYVDEEQAIINEVLDGKTSSVSIDRLVDAYDAAITRFRPEGPYRLAGLSFGGVLAVELASKMRKRGDTVDLVFLFDTLLPEGRRRRRGKWLLRQLKEITGTERERKFRQIYTKLRDRFVGRASGGAAPGRNDAFYQEFVGRQRAAFFEAEKTWQMRSAIDFPVILFRASDHDMWGHDLEFAEDYGWRRYVGDRLHIVRVAGGHRSIIEAPHVAEVGRLAGHFLGATAARY
jgi:amino acid adenylation domain-containing protein